MTNNQKDLWEKLAQKNSKYYVNSDYGRGITDDQYRKSGEEAYKKLIRDDNIIAKKGVILDYGAGSGRLSEFMALDFDKVIVLDISKRMLDEARLRLKGITNIEYLETDGSSIPLADSSLDIVFVYLVFQHIKTREMVEGILKEIFRTLKKGGIFKGLFRSDEQPNMANWWSGVEYSQESIKKVSIPIGFRIIKIESLDLYSYWLWLQK